MMNFEKIYLPDTEAVRGFLDSVWEDTYVDCLTPEAMKRISQNWHRLKEIASEGESDVFCIAAFEENEIVGVSIAYKKDEKAEIKRLYVLPTQQGKGVGKQLLAGVLGSFSTIDTIELLVEVQNEPAIAFYTKHNFSVKEGVKKEKNGIIINLIRMEFSLI